ncbi:MAG: TldD/PmbA family protein [Brevinema sp.]
MKINDLSQLIKNTPVDVAEINYLEKEGSSIVISKGITERCLNVSSSSGSVRVFNKGGMGFSAFNNNDFKNGIEKSIESAEVSANAQKFLADVPIIKDSIENKIVKNPQELSLEEKYEFAQAVHQLITDPAFISTRVEFRNTVNKAIYCSSHGSEISQTKHFTGMSASISIKEGNTIQQAYFSEGTYGGMEILNNIEEKAETIKKRAKELIKAPKIESGIYRVLLNQNLAGVFAHEAFGHMSEADFLSENPELLKKIALGTMIGSEDLNITDDGRQQELCGWCAYDDEGVAAQRRELIKNGNINNYLQSRTTAYDMNMSPTGNGRALNPFFVPIPRMTNTYIENGSRSFESLLEELWDGIYACDMIGGMTNLEMFTFSAAYAYRVEKGKIVGLLRDVVLSGNLFETMKNIIGIGNDLEHHGGLGGCGKAGQNGLPVSTGSPHLLLKDIVIG